MWMEQWIQCDDGGGDDPTVEVLCVSAPPVHQSTTVQYMTVSYHGYFSINI